MINTKNYPEASGRSAIRLASIANSVAQELRRHKSNVELILSVPAFSISLLSYRYPALSFFAQHLDNVSEGSTTGFLVPEIAKVFGASGSVLNHSEHRIPEEAIRRLVERLRSLDMRSLVCARDENEVSRFALYSPDFLAIEPPELIGSGNAVSKARPTLISSSLDALRRGRVADSSTVLLCGAGIVDSIDAKRAVELGAEGILVASGIVKALDWKSKIRSLAKGLIAAKEEQLGRPKKE